MYFAKKSGKPKDDFPALDPNQILSQTKVYALALLEKQSKMHAIEEIFQDDENPILSENKNTVIQKKDVPLIPPDFVKHQQMRRTSNSSQDEEIIEESSCLCFKVKKQKKIFKKKQ